MHSAYIRVSAYIQIPKLENHKTASSKTTESSYMMVMQLIDHGCTLSLAQKVKIHSRDHIWTLMPLACTIYVQETLVHKPFYILVLKLLDHKRAEL